MEIETVSVVGLGALGVLFGQHLSIHMKKDNLRIVADFGRIEKYKRDGIFCNGQACDFNYFPRDQVCAPSHLLIFTVKFSGLADAIEAAQNQVGPDTIILSLLNGISSEEILGQAFCMDKVLYSVAQGMDAVKVANKLSYQHMGMICFGDIIPDKVSENAKAVARFFDKAGLPYELALDMRKRLWGKFMLNVGVNQTAAVFECGYGGLQKNGAARDTMISAMKEVIALSEKENANLTQADLEYWLGVMDVLSPNGKPSLQQDLEAGRHSEVELFAGTVLALGEKHGLFSPTNQMLYDKIKAIESVF